MDNLSPRSGTPRSHDSTCHIVRLAKSHYKVIVDFSISAGVPTNLGGDLTFLNDPGRDRKKLVDMNEVDVSYRKAAPFSLPAERAFVICIEHGSGTANCKMRVVPVAS
ncbi:MAG: hypothetical protein WBW61_12070 [Rhodanobacteraceae bacterium]